MGEIGNRSIRELAHAYSMDPDHLLDRAREMHLDVESVETRLSIRTEHRIGAVLRAELDIAESPPSTESADRAGESSPEDAASLRANTPIRAEEADPAKGAPDDLPLRHDIAPHGRRTESDETEQLQGPPIADKHDTAWSWHITTKVRCTGHVDDYEILLLNTRPGPHDGHDYFRVVIDTSHPTFDDQQAWIDRGTSSREIQYREQCVRLFEDGFHSEFRLRRDTPSRDWADFSEGGRQHGVSLSASQAAALAVLREAKVHGKEVTVSGHLEAYFKEFTTLGQVMPEIVGGDVHAVIESVAFAREAESS